MWSDLFGEASQNGIFFYETLDASGRKTNTITVIRGLEGVAHKESGVGVCAPDHIVFNGSLRGRGEKDNPHFIALAAHGNFAGVADIIAVEINTLRDAQAGRNECVEEGIISDGIFL